MSPAPTSPFISRPAERGAPFPPSGGRLLGGGVAGNERLTTLAGAVLLPILAALGVTIVFIGQLIWLHLFIGLLLIGPLVLKMASTGYRFARYYTRNRAYVRKGPPELPLRLLAPAGVATTLLVFASGVALLVEGPSGRGTLLLLHKASFIAWLAATGLHVLAHLPAVWRHTAGLGSRSPGGRAGEGRDGRALALLGMLVAGVVLAVVLIPDFSAWTAHRVFLHHHHHG